MGQQFRTALIKFAYFFFLSCIGVWNSIIAGNSQSMCVRGPKWRLTLPLSDRRRDYKVNLANSWLVLNSNYDYKEFIYVPSRGIIKSSEAHKTSYKNLIIY